MEEIREIKAEWRKLTPFVIKLLDFLIKFIVIGVKLLPFCPHWFSLEYIIKLNKSNESIQ